MNLWFNFGQFFLYMIINNDIDDEEIETQLQQHGISIDCVPKPWQIMALYNDTDGKNEVSSMIDAWTHFKTTHSVIDY